MVHCEIDLFQDIREYALQCELKRKPRTSPKSPKIEREKKQLLSADDRIFLLRSYGTLVVHIGSGMAAQLIFSCRAARPSLGFL